MEKCPFFQQTALLVGSGRRYGPGGGWPAMFIILLLVIWAVGVWGAPVGPAIRRIRQIRFIRGKKLGLREDLDSAKRDKADPLIRQLEGLLPPVE